MSTYTVGGVEYDVNTGLPVEINEGPPSISSQSQVGIIEGSVVKNKDGTYKYGGINALGINYGTKPYELWSNEEGTSWSIREPVEIELGGSGFSLDGGITSTPGNIVVTDGIQVLGYENVLSDDEIKDGIEIIKDKIDKENITNDGTTSVNVEVSVGTATTTGGTDEKASNGLPDPEPLKVKFGKVDSIIQKLALRNLIYPIDADFGNTQDYMQINQFTYRAPNQKLFFAKDDKEKREFGTAPGQTATQGLFNGSPKEKHLGLVKLPMPNSLADSNNVSWGADQLNALTAAVASGVMGQVGPGINDFTNLITSGGGAGEKFQQLLDLVKKRIGGTFRGIQETAGDFATSGEDLNNLSVLGSSVVGSALLNAFQFGITPETILARGQGVVPNNNLSLLFNSPTLREFTFTWKLTPRSREEAQRVNNIIRFFKQGMAPKKGINTATGAASYFLGTPNVFDLKFKTTTEGGNFFYEGDDINHSVVRIKTCACTGCAVNYTPDGMWNAYERGQPVSVTMSLRFAELEPIFDTDYDEDLFNYDENRPDLQPVPIDAVGY